VLLLRRWAVEWSFAWMARSRWFDRDYERLPETLAGLHLLPSITILMRRFVDVLEFFPK
jgi:hypothetical protein